MSCFERRGRAAGAILVLELNVGVCDSDLFEPGWLGGVLVVLYGR